VSEFGAGVGLADGRYTLERRLGVGGMAAVWLARDERLGRPVAVKALSDLLATDASYVERFRREARVAAGLSHPGLVQVFDFGDEPRPYLVMEYVAGGTLADRLRHGGTGEVDCDVLVRQLLGALVHVHAARIVHRDVKPANILVGEDGVPRLTDFGIAQPEDATRLTSTGGIMGTVRYLAPEVMKGAPATPRSDLYSLGMVVRDCIGEGGGRLARLAERLTAQDPAERPESATAALALVDGVSADAVTERDVTAQTRPIAPVRRRTLPEPRELADGRRQYELKVSGRAAAVAAAALAAVVLLVVLLAGGDDSPPPLPPRAAPLAQQLDALDRSVRALP
jgi:serine/threonine protein kinase